MTTESKRRKPQKPELRVVFDTNALYTGTASDLIRQEAANLIKDSAFPDLEIRWYLPEMVRHERQYQMQKKALELMLPVAKVERLLGHKLAITERILIDSVEKAVAQRLDELGLLILANDYKKVDWHQVALDSAYRKLPFQDGETEKGFRDRMIVECFLQLVDDSPKTPAICRIVLVSADKLVGQAIEARTAGLTNTRVLTTLEELRGLINTLISQVDEDFLAILKPKAQKMFFISEEKTTLFYKESIREKLSEKFATELVVPPLGATNRSNGTWRISAPNFVKKTGRRIHWTSRIEIHAEASRVSHHLSAAASPQEEGLRLTNSLLYTGIKDFLASQATPNVAGASRWGWENVATPAGEVAAITTHKGADVYEVLWSADVTTSKDLRRPSIDDIKHGEPTWEQVG